MSFPDKTELAAIDEALKAEGVTDNAAARVYAVKEFAAGTFSADTAAGWAATLKHDVPKLFDKPKSVESDAANAANAELMASAFVSRSVTARGKLVEAIGEDKANEAAKTFGLTNLHDYVTRGKAPVVGEKADDKTNNKPKRDNPWGSGAQWSITKQGALVRALGVEKASEIARAAGSFIGATRPAKV
jgi:hypothetical protein